MEVTPSKMGVTSLKARQTTFIV